MATKYVKNPSGYCYKIQGNKKVRISKEEYMKKNKKTKGGQYDTSVQSNVMHPSNMPQSLQTKTKTCADQCNNKPNNTSRIYCINKCKNDQSIQVS
jgi:hypothetical protein